MKHIVFSPQALIDVEEIKDYIQSQFGEKEDDQIKIIRVLDARRDFLNILFGIKTQTDDLE